MAEQRRDTLKNFFKKGTLPSEQSFSDLIDSTLNMVDEGFKKTPEKGFEISLVGDNNRLISFFESFESSTSGDAVWMVAYDKNTKRLQIKKPGSETDAVAAMTFSDSGNIGIKKESPIHALDVAGVIGSEGRIGSNAIIGEKSPTDSNDNPQKTVPADGEFHEITGILSGCHAFEIMAGVGGKPKEGKYALINALAMNTFNPHVAWWQRLFDRRKRIKYHQSYYYSRCDRIQLEWQSDKNNPREYHLAMRTSSDFGENIKIRYYITQLWFDPDMSASWKQEIVDEK